MKTISHGAYAAPTLNEQSVNTHQRRLYRTFAPDINVVSKKTLKKKIESITTLFFSLLPAECQPKTISDKWYIATICSISLSLVIPYLLPIAAFSFYKAKRGGIK